ncbi:MULTISPECIES: electron transport complex subunit RsxA [Ruminobacter]|jgi:electron transport complex protein RnfA|uniref:Ion-translocating oxidoreductase complex subunit A n=1 Tax=Ruminobacter amylophilus TaxID=867 RepID=A0A662ZHC3_9GAMM|nr:MULTISPECIES: electron transport complex subunit RsxA [Ruminobacter]SFP33251.1 electron transport complex protein RnfA [Ruminobacter amylophilus]
MSYFLLFISAAIVNNFVLTRFLGICPFIGVSKQLSSATGMGLATTFVLVLTSAACYLMDKLVLVPLDITELRLISYIVVIAGVVQFTEVMVRYISPEIFKLLGIYLPLITTNCIVLGLALLNISLEYNFLEVLVFSLGAGAGFSLVLIIFAAMRERLVHANVPGPFKGSAIALITAGLLSMAFMGFTNLIGQ